jgi:hypothetical protein
MAMNGQGPFSGAGLQSTQVSQVAPPVAAGTSSCALIRLGLGSAEPSALQVPGTGTGTGTSGTSGTQTRPLPSPATPAGATPSPMPAPAPTPSSSGSGPGGTLHVVPIVVTLAVLGAVVGLAYMFRHAIASRFPQVGCGAASSCRAWLGCRVLIRDLQAITGQPPALAVHAARRGDVVRSAWCAGATACQTPAREREALRGVWLGLGHRQPALAAAHLRQALLRSPRATQSCLSLALTPAPACPRTPPPVTLLTTPGAERGQQLPAQQPIQPWLHQSGLRPEAGQPLQHPCWPALRGTRLPRAVPAAERASWPEQHLSRAHAAGTPADEHPWHRVVHTQALWSMLAKPGRCRPLDRHEQHYQRGHALGVMLPLGCLGLPICPG